MSYKSDKFSTRIRKRKDGYSTIAVPPDVAKKYKKGKRVQVTIDED